MPQLIGGKFIVSVWLCPTSIFLLFLLYPYHLVILTSKNSRPFFFSLFRVNFLRLILMILWWPPTDFPHDIYSLCQGSCCLPSEFIVTSGYFLFHLYKVLVCMALFWYKVPVLMVWWCAELHLVCWVISLIWLWCLWRLSIHQFRQFWFLTHKTGADGLGTQ